MQKTDGNCWSFHTRLRVNRSLTCTKHTASLVQLQCEPCNTPARSSRLLARLNHRCCMAAASFFCHCATAALRPATAYKRCGLRSVLGVVVEQAGGRVSLVCPAQCSHTGFSYAPTWQSRSCRTLMPGGFACCAACRPALLESAARRDNMAPTAGVPESVLKKRRRCLLPFGCL